MTPLLLVQPFCVVMERTFFVLRPILEPPLNVILPVENTLIEGDVDAVGS